jgi:hypothetical protein
MTSGLLNAGACCRGKLAFSFQIVRLPGHFLLTCADQKQQRSTVDVSQGKSLQVDLYEQDDFIFARSAGLITAEAVAKELDEMLRNGVKQYGE